VQLTLNIFSYSSNNVITMACAWLAAAAAFRSWMEPSPPTLKLDSISQSPARRGRRSKGAIQAATAEVLIRFTALWEATVCIIRRILNIKKKMKQTDSKSMQEMQSGGATSRPQSRKKIGKENTNEIVWCSKSTRLKNEVQSTNIIYILLHPGIPIILFRSVKFQHASQKYERIYLPLQ